MADVNLTAAFSTVPAGEQVEVKRTLVETIEQLDGLDERALDLHLLTGRNGGEGGGEVDIRHSRPPFAR